MFRSIALVAALALPVALSAAPTLTADLAAAHSEAVALRASADNLAMLARTPMKYSFEAHASELARTRSLADQIGERVRRMNAERATATPAQLARVDAMAARLRDVARNADVAIQTFNHRNGTAGLYSAVYQERVQNLYDGAKALANPAAAGTVSAD
jgi:predicted metallo-beta-lactamase superfamily hydrolase